MTILTRDSDRAPALFLGFSGLKLAGSQVVRV